MAVYSDYKDSGIAWIGDIPTHWNVEKGKHVLSLLERPVLESDEIITCFRDGEVTLRKNRREDGFTVSLKEIGYQGIEPGDLVVHGMDGFAGAIGVSDSRGKATPVLNVMDSNQNKRYLMYYLRTAAYKDVFMSLSTGIRVRSCDLRWNKISAFPFLLPERAEQDRIADYIDVSLSKIDAVIAEAKASIEEYKQWKASIIYEAVTKGLDPDVEMVDSGVEWIGTIPRKWCVGQLGKFVEVFNGDRSSNYPTPEEIVNEGIPFFTSYELSSDEVVMREEGKYLTQEKYESLGGYKAQVGDIIFCLRGSIGKCAINTRYNYGTVASSLMGIRCKTINNRFAFYLLSSSVVGIQNDLLMNGTCAANLSARNVCAYKITVPSLREQGEIADYLDEKCSAISSLISEKEELIIDLENYKKALIFEVVTGKRKVV